MSPKRPVLQQGILALLFLITAAYQARHLRFVADYLTGRVEAVTRPLVVKQGSQVIQEVRGEAENAGVRPGDTLVAINGQPYRGDADLNRALKSAQPGDFLKVTVRRQTGPFPEETLRVPLTQREMTASDQWSFVVAIAVVLPLACVLLGFWVAAVRPRDPLAWLLLALLLSSSQLLTLGRENSEGTLLSSLALAYSTLWSQTWFIWLFLLGLYFPSRLAFERRVPWLKWLIIVPLGASAITLLILTEWFLEDYSLSDRIPSLVWRFLNLPLPLIAIALFFVTISARYFLERTPDARRRLRLLYAGTSLALLPTLALVVIGSMTDKSLDDFPAWIELPCLLLTLLFPLTLAYLIVIHKAMDVSVVIRQGVQYTLARGGITVLQGLLMAALVLTISYVVASHRLRWWQTATLIAAAIMIIMQLRRFMLPVAAWIDRRFFREAYDAEQLLADLGEKVRAILETRPLLETVTTRVAESLHVPRIAVLLEAVGQYRPAYAIGYDRALEVAFPEGATVRQLRQSKEPTRVYLADPANWINTAPEVSAEERSGLSQLEAELLLPLMVKERLLGFMSLGQKRSEEAYSGTDLRLLGSVASQTALALENARLTAVIAEEAAQARAVEAEHQRKTKELEEARQLQLSMLPRGDLRLDRLEIIGRMRTASEVGGDYYDFIALPDDLYCVAVGDATGHGTAAGLVVGMVKMGLTSGLQALDGRAGIKPLIEGLNLALKQSLTRRGIGMCLGVAIIDPATIQAEISSNGMPYPYHYHRASRGLRTMIIKAPPLGFLKHLSVSPVKVQMEPGDVLIWLSDGFEERMNQEGELWGAERVAAALAEICRAEDSAETIAQRLIESSDLAAGGRGNDDDMTVVVLKVRG